MKLPLLAALLALLSILPAPLSAAPLGTAFTYQGRLGDTNGPVNGTNDFQFALFDAAANGSQQGPTVGASAIAVSNGLFTVALDFGAAPFKGASRWLEIRVRPGDSAGDYATLAPRQELTPAPYAMFAPLAGNLPDTVAQQFNGVVSFGAPGAPFSVASNVKVNNLNADLLDGLDSSAFWKLLGNAGTMPGANFVGTTDNQALELKVNNARALRLEPTTNAPNVIGGYSGNSVTPGAYGAVIGGGGTALHPSLGGPWPNTVTDPFGAIAGGLGNRVEGAISFIGGGFSNRVQSAANYTVIAGGVANIVGGDTDANAIGGGGGNRIQSQTDGATIAGGYGNAIGTNCDASAIGGGQANEIAPNSSSATIAGGFLNAIRTNSDSSAVGGGWNNYIAANSPYATIAGGRLNSLGTNSDYGVIGGGDDNSVADNSDRATIAGGAGNDIGTNAWASTIGGGYNNGIAHTSRYATIAGGYANDIGVSAGYSTIGGGVNNGIADSADSATIAGGSGNDIGTNAGSSAIGGGYQNDIGDSSLEATIAGGYRNRIANNSLSTTIAGGEVNDIGAGAYYSTIGGGRSNDVRDNSEAATIAGGYNNHIGTNSTSSTIGGGLNNDIADSSAYATIAGGSVNTVGTNADYATIPGGRYANADKYGQLAYASGPFAAAGDAQASLYVLRRTTTSAGTNELFLDGSSLRMKVPNNGVWSFDLLVVASSRNDYAGYQIRGLIANFSGLVAVLGTPVKTVLYESDSSWDALADEDLANAALVVKVRGAAGTTIRWVASVRTVEVIN